MKPLCGKVVIERVGDPEKIGLIYIPDTVKERPQKGLVLEVGDGVDDVSRGDCIIFQPWSDSWLFAWPGYDDYLAAITPKVIEGKVLISGSNGDHVYEPFRDRVLIKAAEAPTISRGGIHLVEPFLEESQESVVFSTHGEVVACGPATKTIHPGDRILTPKVGGCTIGEWGLGHFFLKESEILAIIEEE